MTNLKNLTLAILMLVPCASVVFADASVPASLHYRITSYDPSIFKAISGSPLEVVLQDARLVPFVEREMSGPVCYAENGQNLATNGIFSVSQIVEKNCDESVNWDGDSADCSGNLYKVTLTAAVSGAKVICLSDNDISLTALKSAFQDDTPSVMTLTP